MLGLLLGLDVLVVRGGEASGERQQGERADDRTESDGRDEGLGGRVGGEGLGQEEEEADSGGRGLFERAVDEGALQSR